MNNIYKVMFRFRQLVVVLAAISIVACSAGMNDQQLLELAKEYLTQNKIRAAAIELKNALQDNPENAEARYLLGQLNLDIGDVAAAEKEFRRAKQAGWNEGHAQIGLARALISSGSFQKALDDIEIKDTYSSDDRADLYGLKALAHAGLGELEQARDVLSKGELINADAFHVQKSGVQLSLASGDVESANKLLKHALSIYPDNPELLLLSAITALENKNESGAAAAFSKIIERDPAGLVTVYGRQARLGQARQQILAKKLDQAELTLAPIFKQNNNDPEVNYLGGMVSFEQGKLNLAEVRLLKVLKVAPDHAQTQLMFGTVSYAQKDYEQAAYYIARYVNAQPENIGARKLLGRTYMLLGQHSQAQTVLQPGMKDSADDAELLALVGLSQLQSGDTVSGIEGLKMAIKASPDSASLREELARAYIATGETDRAIQELETMLAKGGEGERAEYLIMLAHLRAGKFDQAVDVALDMLARKPEDPAILTMVGRVFLASEDIVEATRYFNKALHTRTGYIPATMALGRLEELGGNVEKAEALYEGIAGPENNEEIEPLLALARLAENKSNTKDMLGWLEKARTRAPKNIKPRLVLAEYYLREKQLDKADLMVKEAIRITPGQNTLLALKGRILIAKGQYNEALSAFIELVTKVPDSMFARVLLSETYLKLEQIKDARRQLELVLGKQPYYVPALALMANVELVSGQYAQALVYANQVKKAQPDSYMGYELAGDALLADKKYSEAKTYYEQAWERNQSASLAIKLSENSTRFGKFEEAVKPLLTWLNDYPDDARVLQFLGTAYQNMGQNAKAAEIYEKVLVIQPDNLVSLNNLAWLYSLINNPEAVELAERAYRINPDDSGIQDTYGWVLVQQGQVDKGWRILEQAMKKLFDVPEVRYHYAVALFKSGEKTQARKMLKRLLEQHSAFEGRDEAEKLLK